MKEEVLKGGQSNESVVKIENTVRRVTSENSEFVHKLLKLLEYKNYPYAPRLLGIDDKGREILTFVDGKTVSVNLNDEQLKKIVLMIKQLHDTTAGSELCGNMEVITHCDLAPWNTIIKDNEIIGFIDFDGSQPGKRVDDLAYFLWTFLELGSVNTDNVKQFKRIKMLCDIYGFKSIKELVDAILEQQYKVLSIRNAMIEDGKNIEFNKERINLIKNQIDWIENNRNNIIEEFENTK